MITNSEKEHVLRGALGNWPIAEVFSKKIGYGYFHGFRPSFNCIEGALHPSQVAQRKVLAGRTRESNFLSGSPQGSAGSPWVEDRDDKSALKPKLTCSSVHAGAPDQLAWRDLMS